MAHPGGRPPRYTDADAEKVQQLIDDYFIACEGKPLIDDDGKAVLDKHDRPIIIGVKPPTVTGLCLALGFLSRDALLDYQYDEDGNNPKLSDAIIRAKLRCHEYAESRLYDKDGANGAKFSLANNFGWVDRQEIVTEVIALPAAERRARLADPLGKKALPTATYSIEAGDDDSDAKE